MNWDKIGKFVYDTQNMKDENRSDIIGIAVTGITETINEDDYDTAVTMAVMCFNKVLSETMESVDIDSENFYDDVDNIAKEAEIALENELLGGLDLPDSEDNREFNKYILYIFDQIADAFKSHKSITFGIIEDEPEKMNIKNLEYENSLKFAEELRLKSYLITEQLSAYHYYYKTLRNLIPEFNRNENPLTSFTSKNNIKLPYYYCFVEDYIREIVNEHSLTESYSVDNVQKNKEQFKNETDILDYGSYARRFLTYKKIIPELIEYKNGIMYYYPDVQIVAHKIDIGFGISPFFTDRPLKYSEQKKLQKLDIFKYLPSIKEYDNTFKIEHKKPNISFDEYISENMSEEAKEAINYSKSLFNYEIYESNRFLYRILPLCPLYLNNFVGQRKMTFDIAQEKFNRITAMAEEFEKDRLELAKVNAELEKALQDKASIVSEFTHRFINMDLSILEDISIALLKNENTKEQGVALTSEAGFYNTMRDDVNIMRLRYKNETDSIANMLKNSMGNEYNIWHIIEEIFRHVMIRVLKTKKTMCDKEIFNRIFGKDNDTEKLYKTYINDVLIEKKYSDEWLNTNSNIKFEISVDPNSLWDSMFFKHHGTAYSFFVSQLYDLFYNAFKYAELTEPIYFNFTSDGEFLHIGCKNKIAEIKEKYGTLSGIKHIRKFFNDLNKIEDSVDEKNNGEHFEIKLKLKKDLFFGEEQDHEQ